MAPVTNMRLHTRQLATNKIFPITFGIVAFSIIVAAIFWARAWPCIRVRYINSRFPSRTRFRDEYNILHPMKGRLESMKFWHRKATPPMFPSHPAVLHGNRRQPLRSRPPLYGSTPRIWPHDVSQSSEDIKLPELRSQSRSVADLSNSIANHAVVKPRHKHSQGNSWLVEKSMTMPRTQTEYDRARSIVSDHGFGDAREYILAIPEPLVLRARSPILRSVPIPRHKSINISSYERSGPKKEHISRELHAVPEAGAGAERTPAKTARSTESYSTRSDASEVSTFEEEEDKTSVAANSFDTRGHSIADLSESGSEKAEEQGWAHNKSLAALHRLKTYRSLTGAHSIQPLTRAGTLTRPKTPVAEIRKLYAPERDAGGFASGVNSYGTSSSGPWTTAAESAGLASTVQTSPDATASTTSLLPNRLQVRSSPEDVDIQGSSVSSIHSHDIFTEVEHTPPANRCNDQEPVRAYITAARARNTPHLLKLASHIPVAVRRGRSVQPVYLRESVRDPLIRGRPDTASSIYSRDTRGFSIFRDQLSTNTENAHDQTCDSSSSSKRHLQKGCDKPNLRGLKDFNRAFELGKKNEGRQIHLQSSIQAPGRDFPAATTLKHVLSDLGPRRSNRHDLFTTEEGSEVSAISTELNSLDEEAVRHSLPRMCVRESNIGIIRVSSDTSIEAIPFRTTIRTTSDTTVALINRGRAPGGAEWI